MNLRRVWVQCSKELIEFRRDRLTVALAFALPIGMLMIFGFAIRLQMRNIPVAVVDFDRSPFSREFIARINASQELVVIPARLDRSPIELLDAGNLSAAIVIPPGTQQAITAGRDAPIQGLVDATDVVNALTIKQILTAASSFVGAMYARASTAGFVPARVSLHERIWFNPGDNEALFIVPGVYAVILAIFPTLLAAIAMVRDTEQGTIVQAYASRLRASELIMGKGLALTAIGLAEALVLMLMGFAVWGVRFAGDPLPLLVGTPLFVSCQVLLGLFVGARLKTVTSAIQASGSVNSLLSVLLSGFLYPISAMPLVFGWLSYVIPARHFITITRDAFVRGAGWSDVCGDLAALAVIAALLALGAWFPLRRMQMTNGS